MNKKKIRNNIIYYVLIFIFGALLALFLPAIIYVVDKETKVPEYVIKTTASSLENGNYSEAMSLWDSYYNSDPVFVYEDADCRIVIFEAATVQTSEDEEGNLLETAVMQKTYSGFLYSSNGTYDLSGADSSAAVAVRDKNGIVRNFSLSPDYDSDKDGTPDKVLTFNAAYFICFDLDAESYKDIKNISFLDVNGNVYKNLSLDLSYSGKFFSDIEPIISTYNSDNNSKELNPKSDELLSNNPSYKIGTMGKAAKYCMDNAQRSANIAVIVYFVLAYMIGDMTLGARYINRFIKFVLRKCFKIDLDKNKKTVDEKEFLGTDYYCRVTVSLDITEAESFDSAVTVKYSNPESDVEFILLRSDDYVATKRIRSGKYLNPWIDLAPEYEASGMPSALEADSYTKNIIIKIKERKQGVS